MQTDLFDNRDLPQFIIPELIKHWVQVHSYFVPEHELGDLFNTLITELDWQQPEIQVFGKNHRIPRLQSWYSDKGVSYQYSGTEMTERKWHPVLAKIKDEVNRLTGRNFNSALVNYYRDGQDKMGWHADNEPELGPNPVVVSLSLGEARDMHFRDNETKQTASLRLNSGALLIMKAGMQRHFQHQIPVRQKVSGGRISITFRQIY